MTLCHGFWEWNSDLCACQISTLLTKLSTIPTHIFQKRNFQKFQFCSSFWQFSNYRKRIMFKCVLKRKSPCKTKIEKNLTNSITLINICVSPEILSIKTYRFLRSRPFDIHLPCRSGVLWVRFLERPFHLLLCLSFLQVQLRDSNC